MAEIISGARVRTYEVMRAFAARAASGFRALGVGEGDRVALLLRNDFVFLEAQLAAGMAGAYPVPVNFHAAAADVGFLLRDSGAKILVVHADLLGGVRAALPAGICVIAVETPDEIGAALGVVSVPPPDGALRWEDWVMGFEPIGDPSTAVRGAVIYTSGTTGRPKGVFRAPAPAGATSPRAMRVYGLDLRPPIRILVTGPLYHSVPNAYARLGLRVEADIVLQPKFEAEGFLELVERHRITHAHMVPAMFVRLLRLPAAVRARYDVSSLRHVVHGAAPCPPAVKAAMLEWFGPVVFEYYGSTETGLLTLLGPDEAARKPGSVGRALNGIVLQVFGDEGEAPAGVVGDVYAGSATLHEFTYLGQAQKRAEIGRGDLVTAGDVGWLDDEGFLYLCDRRRDVMVCGGVTIYAAEIEAVILALPAVRDCAVFGIPDAQLGEAVCAYVEPVGMVDVEALTTALQGRLAGVKMPRRIEIVDALPREDTGKIFKARLREKYWG
jgi:long-chain acyl-CoA synthetase